LESANRKPDLSGAAATAIGAAQQAAKIAALAIAAQRFIAIDCMGPTGENSGCDAAITDPKILNPRHQFIVNVQVVV